MAPSKRKRPGRLENWCASRMTSIRSRPQSGEIESSSRLRAERVVTYSPPEPSPTPISASARDDGKQKVSPPMLDALPTLDLSSFTYISPCTQPSGARRLETALANNPPQPTLPQTAHRRPPLTHHLLRTLAGANPARPRESRTWIAKRQSAAT